MKSFIPGISFLVWLIVLTGIEINPCTAQSVTYTVEHYSSAQGLLNPRTRSLLIHSNGFVYVGTSGGLSRFDGYTFKTIMLPVHENYDLNEFGIARLFEAQDNSILVILSEQQGKSMFMVAVDPDSHLCTVLEKVEGGYNGIESPYEYQGNSVDLDHIPYRLAGSVLQDEAGNVLSIQQDGQTRDQKAILRLANGQLVDLTEAILQTGSNATVYSRDLGETILVSTNNTGLLKISIDVPDFRNYMASDIEGWQYKFQCRAIAEAHDSLLIGTYAHGIYLCHKTTGNCLPLELKGDNDVAPSVDELRGIHALNDSIVWASPYYGGPVIINLSQRSARRWMGIKISMITQSIQLRDGRLAFIVGSSDPAYGKGILIIDPDNLDFEFASLRELNVPTDFVESFLLEDTNGIFWLSTTTGLFKIDLVKRKTLAAYFSTNDVREHDQLTCPSYRILSSSHIISLNEQDGNYWIGTYGGGISLLDSEGNSIGEFNVDNGLVNNIVCGLIKDSTGMWIATFDGLAHYNTSSGAFSNFSMGNGLAHNEFNRWSGYISPSGTYYIGTMNGVTSFMPGDILNREVRTRILLSEVGYYDKGGQDQIVRNAFDQSELTFELPAANRSFYAKVALSNFKNSSSNTYSYRLISDRSLADVDESWRTAGTGREIRFEYLPAGSYTLRIRAVTSNGIATAGDLVIRLHVQEFFYRTWWFIALCLFSLGGLMYIFYRNRLASAIKMERLRTRLSSDLHDDVGSVLSGVAYQMDLLEYTADEKQKPLMRQVAESSRQAMSKMRDVVWAIDSRKATFQHLIDRMHEFVEETLFPLNIGFAITEDNLNRQSQLSSEIRHNVLSIFKEFATNTIKHSGADNVKVHMSQAGRQVVMKFSDNGKGFKADDVSGTGQGIDNMKLRAERLGGDLQFSNEPGFCAELRFTI